MASAFLGGCGGFEEDPSLNGPQGNGGGPVTPPNTAEVTGLVDRSAFPDVANLQIQSAWQPNTAVAADGSFTTVASTEGPQLIFLTGSPIAAQAQGEIGNVLYGLAVVVPDVIGKFAQLNMNVASTAASLIFMTPGVLVTGLEEAGELLKKIAEKLPTFAAFVANMARELSTNPLKFVMNTPLNRTFLDTLYKEILGTLPAPGGLTAKFKDENDPASPVDLSNAGWRFVSLIRQDLGAGGVELARTFPKLTSQSLPFLANEHNMPGATAISWGNLFTQQSGGAAAASDPRLEVRPGIQKIRYTVFGPGNGFNNPPLPPEIQPGEIDLSPLGLSVIYYLVFPLVDLIGGFGDGLAGGYKAALTVWSSISTNTSLEGLNNAFKNFETSGLAGVEAAVIDLLTGAVGLGAAIGTVLAGAAEAATITLVATVLGGFAAVFGVVNLTLAVDNWRKLNLVDVVELTPGVAGVRLFEDSRVIVDVNATGDYVWSNGEFFLNQGGVDIKLPGLIPVGGLGVGDRPLSDNGNCIFMKDFSGDVDGVRVRKADGTIVTLSGAAALPFSQSQALVASVDNPLADSVIGIVHGGATSDQDIWIPTLDGLSSSNIGLRQLMGLPTGVGFQCLSLFTNGRGQIAGTFAHYDDPNSGANYSFLLTPGEPIEVFDIGQASGFGSQVLALNNSGEVLFRRRTIGPNPTFTIVLRKADGQEVNVLPSLSFVTQADFNNTGQLIYFAASDENGEDVILVEGVKESSIKERISGAIGFSFSADRGICDGFVWGTAHFPDATTKAAIVAI